MKVAPMYKSMWKNTQVEFFFHGLTRFVTNATLVITDVTAFLPACYSYDVSRPTGFNGAETNCRIARILGILKPGFHIVVSVVSVVSVVRKKFIGQI